MGEHAQEREAKLVPVVLSIFGCYVAIVVGSYLIAQLF